MDFKEALDKFIQEMKENIIPEKSIEIKGYEVIPNNIIKDIYFSIEESSMYDDIKRKLDRTSLILSKYIENNYDLIMSNVKNQYQKNINIVSKELNKNELNKLTLIEKEVNNSCKSSIKKYFSGLIPNVLNTYIKFLTNLKKYINPEVYNDVKTKMQNNITNIKARKVEFEDLSALIYLKCKMLGVEPYEEYRQVAIDEAQDFGDFSFYALKSLLRNATFSIFGDLAQSIYQYRGINNWQNVANNTFKEKCDMKYLLKSYRTTTEMKKPHLLMINCEVII